MKQLVFKGKRMKEMFSGEKAEDVKREALPEVPIILRSVKSQYNLLCELHYGVDTAKSVNGPNLAQGVNNMNEYYSLLTRELNAKLNGYKQQDIRKKLFDDETIIKPEELRQKLIDETLTCVFCNKQVKLLYEKVRDELQWTLDRINNDLGHSNENTRIACLKCNLKRRRTDYDKFHWTKNLSISKLEDTHTHTQIDDNENENDNENEITD